MMRINIYELSFFSVEQFSFESCKFKIQKGKEGTGRIVMWHMGVMNSYTMEVSYHHVSVVPGNPG